MMRMKQLFMVGLCAALASLTGGCGAQEEAAADPRQKDAAVPALAGGAQALQSICGSNPYFHVPTTSSYYKSPYNYRYCCDIAYRPANAPTWAVSFWYTSPYPHSNSSWNWGSVRCCKYSTYGWPASC